jgi:hypothetical protein
VDCIWFNLWIVGHETIKQTLFFQLHYRTLLTAALLCCTHTQTSLSGISHVTALLPHHTETQSSKQKERDGAYMIHYKAAIEMKA